MKKQIILSGLVMAFLASSAVFAEGDDMSVDSPQNGQSQMAPQSGMPSEPNSNTQNGQGNTDTTPNSQVDGSNGSY